jgi:hypothetical protein
MIDWLINKGRKRKQAQLAAGAISTMVEGSLYRSLDHSGSGDDVDKDKDKEMEEEKEKKATVSSNDKSQSEDKKGNAKVMALFIRVSLTPS